MGDKYGPVIEEAMRPIFRILSLMNCTEKPISWAHAGLLGPNGSFDGLAGIVQRNEVDILFNAYRTDFSPIVIGHLTTNGYPADFLIISRKNGSLLTHHPLFDLWMSSFDFVTVAFTLISIFLFLTVLIWTETCMVLHFDHNLVHWVWERTQTILFKFYSSCVAQENFDPETNSGRILVWFFSLFILFFVHGFVLGAMGADLVTINDPPFINSLDAFTNTSYTQPVVVKQFYLLHLLERAVPGTPVWDLKKLVYSNPDQHILDIDVSGDLNKVQQVALNLLNEVHNSRKSLLLTERMYPIIKYQGCQYLPDIAKNIERSKYLFAPGQFSQIMSLKIDPKLRQVWNYIIGSITEFRWVDAAQVNVLKTFSIMTHGRTPKGCDDIDVAKEQIIEAFSVETFGPFFHICGMLLSVSAVVLLMERNVRIHRFRRFFATCVRLVFRGNRALFSFLISTATTTIALSLTVPTAIIRCTTRHRRYQVHPLPM